MAKIVKTQVEIEGKWHEQESLVETDDLKRWDAGADLSVVGQPVSRVDGFERVSGAAQYTQDVQLPGMLYGVMLRSAYPHARIRRIDHSDAEKLAGVRCVLTNESAVGLPYHGSEPLFSNTARFEGEELAAVAAVDSETAMEAISLIRVEYEELPFVVDPLDALRSGAPALKADGNRAGDPLTYKRGDIDAGFSQADAIIDRTFSTPAALHNSFETHGAVAMWEGEHITVWHSTQYIFGVREEMAQALGMPLSHVRVIKRYIGGGFGSKIDAGKYGICAALMSRKTGRPVRVCLSRREENLAAGNRPSAVIQVRLGARTDGTLTAIEEKSISAVGAYGNGSPPVTGPAKELYACDNVFTEEQGVLTNTGPSSAFRAPGYVEGTFALESAMDELADKLGIDPVELRLRNHTDRQQVRDLPYSSKDLLASYAMGKETIGWERKRGSLSRSGNTRRGVGMASQIWGGGGTAPSYAIARMNSDGTLDVLTGSQDIGTGTKTVMAQITAEELGVNIEKIHVVVGDTLAGPYGILSAGSLTVPSVGPAVRMAAKDVKDQIIDVASAILDEPAEQLAIRDGAVVSESGSEITIDKLAEKVGNFMIIGKGARGPNPDQYIVNTFGAHFAEVEVDMETGEVTVLSIVAVHEFGRVINPLTLSSQVEGGAIQGLGFGLYEGRIVDRNTGKSVNPNLEDYKIPTAMDIPDIVPQVVDQVDPIATSIGSKGAGEPPIIPPAAAVANAVCDAIGIRIYDLPITPAKVLDALKKSGGEA
jgi:CO/xanthine dehydrogenase Mo-binding subunit